MVLVLRVKSEFGTLYANWTVYNDGTYWSWILANVISCENCASACQSYGIFVVGTDGQNDSDQ